MPDAPGGASGVRARSMCPMLSREVMKRTSGPHFVAADAVLAIGRAPSGVAVVRMLASDEPACGSDSAIVRKKLGTERSWGRYASLSAAEPWASSRSAAQPADCRASRRPTTRRRRIASGRRAVAPFCGPGRRTASGDVRGGARRGRGWSVAHSRWWEARNIDHRAISVARGPCARWGSAPLSRKRWPTSRRRRRCCLARWTAYRWVGLPSRSRSKASSPLCATRMAPP